MPTSREVDSNGFLLVKGCPISSFGIFDYGAGQVGLDGDPGRIVKVFRPESAVTDQASIDSFKNVPFINDHEMLSGFQSDDAATAPEDYGVSGVLTSNVYYEQPWMRGDLKIFSRDVQADLANGKKDLSLGYSCDFELKPGVFNGEAYEVIQTNLRGNHIALVQDGRVTGARVLDGLCFDHLCFDVRSSDNKERVMKKAVSKAVMDNAVEQLKALLPALTQFLNEEATGPAHQDPNAGVEADSADPAAVDPNQAAAVVDPGEATPDLPALIGSIEAVLAKLKSMAPADSDESQNNAAGIEDEGETEGLKQDGAAAVKDGDVAASVEDQEKTANGQAAGINSKASDSALRSFYVDSAAKARIYDRLSSVVGAFDHAAMDSHQINSYGVKKLGIKCADGQENVALDAYLNGVEAAQKTTKQRVQARVADAAASTAEIDAYLNGGA